MRSRTVAALGASAAALTCAAVFAPGASAHPASGRASHTVSASQNGTDSTPAKGRRICFKNAKLKFATGDDIPSNTYADGDSPFNSQAADDFTLTTPCVAREVDVVGTFDKQSKVEWQNVYIYRDVNGEPATFALWVQTAIDGTPGKQSGDFKLPIGPVTLQPGKYWMSVQMQLVNGQWGWDTTSKASGDSALFQNPGEGFPGCPTWTAIQTCFPGTSGQDLMFTLKS